MKKTIVMSLVAVAALSSGLASARTTFGEPVVPENQRSSEIPGLQPVEHVGVKKAPKSDDSVKFAYNPEAAAIPAAAPADAGAAVPPAAPAVDGTGAAMPAAPAVDGAAPVGAEPASSAPVEGTVMPAAPAQ